LEWLSTAALSMIAPKLARWGAITLAATVYRNLQRIAHSFTKRASFKTFTSSCKVQHYQHILITVLMFRFQLTSLCQTTFFWNLFHFYAEAAASVISTNASRGSIASELLRSAHHRCVWRNGRKLRQSRKSVQSRRPLCRITWDYFQLQKSCLYDI